jgi:phage terminase Nu1 subunit (DNA packaging protein)
VKLTRLFVVVLFLALPGLAQKPIPPGIRQADKITQSQQNTPPPLVQRASVDPAKLKRDADELANLAASIPSAVNQTNMGLLPKDLDQKLKRIEKLAKQLRSQIAR